MVSIHSGWQLMQVRPMRAGIVALALFGAGVFGCTRAMHPGQQTSTQGPMSAAVAYLAAISVADLQRSQSWYIDKLGFHLVTTTSMSDRGAAAATLELNGYFLELVQLNGSAPRLTASTNPRAPASVQGVFKLTFLVPDLDATAALLQVRGVPFRNPPTTDEQVGVRYLILEDPDGNLLQLVQRLGKESTRAGANSARRRRDESLVAGVLGWMGAAVGLG